MIEYLLTEPAPGLFWVRPLRDLTAHFSIEMFHGIVSAIWERGSTSFVIDLRGVECDASEPERDWFFAALPETGLTPEHRIGIVLNPAQPSQAECWGAVADAGFCVRTFADEDAASAWVLSDGECPSYAAGGTEGKP